MKSLKDMLFEKLADQEKMFAKEFEKQKAAASRKEENDAAFIETIKKVIKAGYICDVDNPKKKYGASEDNFLGKPGESCIVSVDEVSKEQLKKIVDELTKENGGKDPWRFHTRKEYKGKGYLDPPTAE